MFFPAPGTIVTPTEAETYGEARTFTLHTDKEFEDVSSPYLRVPGLKKLTAIKFGHTNVPLEQNLSFPSGRTTEAFAQKIPVVWPLFSLSKDTDGTPVLLRSLNSNDGVWQQNMPVTVFGEWEAPKPVR